MTVAVVAACVFVHHVATTPGSGFGRCIGFGFLVLVLVLVLASVVHVAVAARGRRVQKEKRARTRDSNLVRRLSQVGDTDAAVARSAAVAASDGQRLTERTKAMQRVGRVLARHKAKVRALRHQAQRRGLNKDSDITDATGEAVSATATAGPLPPSAQQRVRLRQRLASTAERVRVATALKRARAQRGKRRKAPTDRSSSWMVGRPVGVAKSQQPPGATVADIIDVYCQPDGAPRPTFGAMPVATTVRLGNGRMLEHPPRGFDVIQVRPPPPPFSTLGCPLVLACCLVVPVVASTVRTSPMHHGSSCLSSCVRCGMPVVDL